MGIYIYMCNLGEWGRETSLVPWNLVPWNKGKVCFDEQGLEVKVGPDG